MGDSKLPEEELTLDAGMRDGKSTILHSRQLFREALMNAYCLNSPGKTKARHDTG
jgi:hypothetical protein